MNTLIKLLSVAMAIMIPTVVYGDGTIDRDYGFGDDPFEGAAQGALVGSGNNFGLTFDSMGSVGAGDLQDLLVSGAPQYANVSDRPQFSGGLGISFDGTSDYLLGPNLNLPASSAAAVGYDDDPSGNSIPGPLLYDDLADRYFQLWVQPDTAGASATQSIVMDSNQHGLRIESGQWSMRYGGADFASGVSVDFGEWSHVMVARPFGPEGGSRLYVNGVAIAAAPGGYNGAATEELVVGSNTGRDFDLNFTGGTSEFFNGVLDDLSMVVLGDNSASGGQDWGSFSFQSENAFAAEALVGVNIADVNLDGVVSGNGTGPAASDDVSAFVDGWRTRNEINGVTVGDLSTRAIGDLDYNGVVDLLDFSILNSADPSMGAAVQRVLANVPEPQGLPLMLIAFGLLARMRAASRR